MDMLLADVMRSIEDLEEGWHASATSEKRGSEAPVRE